MTSKAVDDNFTNKISNYVLIRFTFECRNALQWKAQMVLFNLNFLSRNSLRWKAKNVLIHSLYIFKLKFSISLSYTIRLYNSDPLSGILKPAK